MVNIFMFCSRVQSYCEAPLEAPHSAEERIQIGKQERDALITALALVIIALFLFAVSFILLGLGTLSTTFLQGLGVFPYFAGAFLSYIALGVMCGGFVFAAISGVLAYKRNLPQPEAL